MNKIYCTILAALYMLPVNLLNAQSSSWLEIVTTSKGLDSFRSFAPFVADINNDNYPDIISVEGAWSAVAVNNLRVYLNIQDTQSTNPNDRLFIDITTQSGINAKPGGGDSRGRLAVALADINNDGNIDLVKGSYYHRLSTYIDSGDRCEVMLGDGMGNFTLVPGNGLHELGLVNTMGFSFLDYDKDGNIDLFIARWFEDYDRNTTSAGILMKGNGDGTFTNVSQQAGITQREPMYGCGVVDWNNDGWPDIATAPYCRTGGQLWKNNGDGTFTNVAAEVNYNAHYMQGDNGQNLCMWSSVPADFDNDGDMDFFFSLVHGGLDANEGRSTIFVNEGAANSYKLSPNRDLTPRATPRSTHLGDYDASWFDLDNDGLEDIVMMQGQYMPSTDRIYIFHQQPGHTFKDITPTLQLINDTTKDVHLTEVFDYDLDGDDDILFCRNGQPRTLNIIENKKGQDNHWIGIQLIAPEGVNKSSIGARIYLWSNGVQRMREVYAGRGNGSGQQPFALLFGLGESNIVDSIKVYWPDVNQSVTSLTHPDVDRYVTIGPEVNGNGGYTDPVRIVKRDKERQINLKIYPNPVKDFVLLQMSDNREMKKVELYDATGRWLRNYEGSMLSSRGASFIPLYGLPVGSYYLKITTENQELYKGMVIKLAE